MFYALANTLANIRDVIIEIIVPPNNNGYKSPSPDFFFYVAPNSGKYYIQP
jgi:hypothetical protein